MHAPDTIKIDEVTRFEQLVEGVWVYQSDGTRFWRPSCRQAHAAIQRAITCVLRHQTCLQSQTREELTSEISARLALCSNQSFFSSKNRAGWIFMFALHWGKNFLRVRIREANQAKRISERLKTDSTPAETPLDYRKRKSFEREDLRFDRHQFDGKRGHGPDDMTLLSDSAEQRLIEQGVDGDAETVVLIRQELRRLPLIEQDFFMDYLDSRYERKHAAAERKRFERLCKKIRAALSQTRPN